MLVLVFMCVCTAGGVPTHFPQNFCRDADDDAATTAKPAAAASLGAAAAAAAAINVGRGPHSGSIFDSQLPVAGLQLLAGLMGRSRTALEWVAGQPDRCVCWGLVGLSGF